jgi:hypothetical protein
MEFFLCSSSNSFVLPLVTKLTSARPRHRKPHVISYEMSLNSGIVRTPVTYRHHADHVAPSNPQKLALTSPTSGGRSVGIVGSRTQATEFSFFFFF